MTQGGLQEAESQRACSRSGAHPGQLGLHTPVVHLVLVEGHVLLRAVQHHHVVVRESLAALEATTRRRRGSRVGGKRHSFINVGNKMATLYCVVHNTIQYNTIQFSTMLDR